MKTSERRRNQQSGISLFIATTSLLFIIPMMGLSVDTGFLYGAKAQLQGSVDGAALAAGRALNLGQTTAAQAGNAKQNALNWFTANFPTGAWGTTNTQMDTSDSHVLVYDDAINPNLQHVDVTASTTVPTYFMKWFGTNATTITAKGFATRRDVVAMLVLDRSGSMGTSCANLKTAAKIFTGQFAPGRDRIGLISFSDGADIQQSPSTNFQTLLGYSGNGGSGTGAIDTISCIGGTNTSTAVSLAYNELYKIMLPGALNLILLETDGRPTAAAFNWYDGQAFGIAAGSGCKDASNTTLASGGWAVPTPHPALPSQPTTTRAWFGGLNMDGVDAAHPGYIPDIPAGAMGTIYADTSGSGVSYALWNPIHTAPTQYQVGMAASGCLFNSTAVNNTTPTTSWNDFAWLPQTDMWGNAIQFTPDNYKSVTTGTNGRYIMTGSTTTNRTNVQNAEINVADNAAYRARTSQKSCAGSSCTPTAQALKAYFFAVGFTSSVDHTLLQRMANDPNGDRFNSPSNYNNCATTTGCVNYSDQPQGMYVYAPDTTKLNNAFLSISSQVLRLSN